MEANNLNFRVIGYTKKNLSPVVRVGYADFGDFRHGTNIISDWDGNFYRPSVISNAGIEFNEFYYKEFLPNEFSKVAEREYVPSEKSKRIISEINKTYIGSVPNIVDYIVTLFRYETYVCGNSIHNVVFPEKYSIDYHIMLNAIRLKEELEELKRKHTLTTMQRNSCESELRKLKDKVFNRFFVGKIGKNKATIDKQRETFINLI